MVFVGGTIMNPENNFTIRFRRNRTPKEKRLALFRSALVSIINWISGTVLAVLVIFSWTMEPDTGIWNMNQHCKDPKFNHTVIHLSVAWPVIWTMSNLCIVFVLMTIRTCIVNDRGKKDLFNFANFFIGLVLNWSVTKIMQNLLSSPIPSFYTNNDLKLFYCCKNCSALVTKELLKLDLKSRGSFPSFLMTFGWYSASYLHMYVESADRSQSFVAGIIFPITSCMAFSYFGYILYSRHHCHLEDVIGGALIGVFLGIFMGKALYRARKKSKFNEESMSVIMNRSSPLRIVPVDNHYIDMCPHQNRCTNCPAENIELGNLRDGGLSVIDEEPPPYNTIVN